MVDATGVDEFQILVYDAGDNATVHVRAEGDLSQTVRFEQTSAQLDRDVAFKGRIRVPENLVPGDHEQRIIVSADSAQAQGFGARVEVASLLVVRKTFSGAYVVADLYSSPDNGVLDTTNIIITLENRGDKGFVPIVTLTLNHTNQTLSSGLLESKQSQQLKTVLHARGEYDVQLSITGAQEFQKTYPVVIGHPVIERLEARAPAESGAIQPILIDTTVSWNRPVTAEVAIGQPPQQKTYSTTILGAQRLTYYIETDASSVPVVLRIGSQERSVIVALRQKAVPPQESNTVLWTIAMVVLIAVIALLLLHYVKKRAKA